MSRQINKTIITPVSLIIVLISLFLPLAAESETRRVTVGNFGLPGILDLPTARHLADGDLVLTHQNHKYLFMSGISFQALPRLGLHFDMEDKVSEAEWLRVE